MRTKIMKAILVLFSFLSTCMAFAGGKLITLENAVEMAVSNNLQIAAGMEKIKQAEYERNAVSTFFLPKISSSLSYTRMNEAQEMMGVIFADSNLYNLAIALNQPLYTGGRLNAVYEQAKEDVKRRGFEKDIIVQELISGTKRGYFSILKAEKGLQTVKTQKEMAQEHLRKAELMFREGIVTKVDVLKTEVFLSDIEQQILAMENSISLAKASLSFLLNQPLSTEFEIEDILEKQKEKNDLDYWTRLSYKSRPELKQLESAGRIYEYNIDVAESGRKPQVALFYNYMVDRGSAAPVDRWNNSWNIGVALEMDIWNWGETGDRIQKAIHAKKEVDTEYSLLLKAVELEVKTALLNMETAARQTENIKKSLEKAEENLRVTNLLYSEGMLTTTDVLDAQSDLASARNRYYQSLYDYQLAYAELEKSAGVHLPDWNKN